MLRIEGIFCVLFYLLATTTFMPTPQSMLSVVARNEIHLQFKLLENYDQTKFFKDLGRLWNADATGIDDPTLNRHHEYAGGTANIVLGFRPEYWRNVYADDVPDNLSSYSQNLIGTNGMTAPATQQDLWVWITQSTAATLFDTMNKTLNLLKPYAELVSEQVCFPYHNNITFDGFADGVANPNPFRANDVAIIPDRQKGAGGSTVLLQKWVMDIEKLRNLPVREAEKVYGRTKGGSHELSPMPDNSHVGKTKFLRNGKEIDIVRRNANFGNAHEAGVMFVGFSNDISVTLGMLEQMYGVGADGNTHTDRLIDFSQAVSSAIYFVPSLESLAKMNIMPEDED